MTFCGLGLYNLTVKIPTAYRSETRDNDKKICSSAFYFADEELNILSGVQIHEAYSLKDNLLKCCVSDCSLIHKSVLDEYGPFDTAMENMAHWDFWLRVGERNSEFFMYNPEPLWLYRQHKKKRSGQRRADAAGAKKKIEKRETARKKMLRKHFHTLEK